MELLLNRPEGEFSRFLRLLLRLMVLLSLHCWKGWRAQLVEVVVQLCCARFIFLAVL